MEKTTFQDCQNVPLASVYLTLIMQKGRKGKIPAMTICPVIRKGQSFVRLNYGGFINPKKYALVNTKPLSEYYQKDQYRIYVEGERISIEFDDRKPYERYIEYAGRSFDRYVKRYSLRSKH